jgi:hypothetical protein
MFLNSKLLIISELINFYSYNENKKNRFTNL